MITYLPKVTNYGIPKDIKFEGIEAHMSYDERNAIARANNIAWTKQQYETMGIEVLEEVDDLFVKVSLPEGWTEKKEDGYWSSVLNEEGKPRISYFDKPAIWDADAFSNFERRYSFQIVPYDEYKIEGNYEQRKFQPWSLYITDGEERLALLNQITPKTNKEYLELDEIFEKEAKEFLDAHYPDWQNVNAYWENPSKDNKITLNLTM